MRHREPYPISCVHGKHRSHSSEEQISFQITDAATFNQRCFLCLSAIEESDCLVTFPLTHRCSFCGISDLNFDVVFFFLSANPRLIPEFSVLSQIVDFRK